MNKLAQKDQHAKQETQRADREAKRRAEETERADRMEAENAELRRRADMKDAENAELLQELAHMKAQMSHRPVLIV